MQLFTYACTHRGTFRLHGEKFKNQPRYRGGDVVGFTVDNLRRDLTIYLNGIMVKEWPGALRPGATWRPCVCTMIPRSGATLLSGTFLPFIEVGDDVQWEGADSLVFDTKSLPTVDGSLLEGGGQVLRIALGVGALATRRLRVINIRTGKGRAKPGLKSQHSAGIRLVARICGATITPPEILYGGQMAGVSDITMIPGTRGLRPGRFTADCQSAGAITLMMQAALPCALLGPHRDSMSLTLRGGTNTKWSPTIDFTRMVLVPTLQCMGVPKAGLRVNVVRRGFYPIGLGEVLVEVNPLHSLLRPICMTTRGSPINIIGVVCGGGIGRRVCGAVAAEATRRLRISFGSNINISISVGSEPDGFQYGKRQLDNTARSRIASQCQEVPSQNKLTFKEREEIASERRLRTCGATSLQLVLVTDTGCRISGNGLVEAGGKHGGTIVEPKDVVDEAIAMLMENWEAGGCCDEFLADQLVVFMAYASGPSRLICNGRTAISSLHLQTAVYFTELLTGVQFTMVEVDGATGRPCVQVECSGQAPHLK